MSGAAETLITKWKGGKKAVFLLAFDDSCPSHVDNAIPELEKHGLVGTFYICAGNEAYRNRREQWEAAARSPAVVFGNHTFTHAGAMNARQLEKELTQANEAIFDLRPTLKHPRLLSFAVPGGVPWTVEAEELDELLIKYNLLRRPDFKGPPFTFATLEEAYGLVDATIQGGEMAQIGFHGVGGDWLSVGMDYYVPLLERLRAKLDQLWVTDHISYAKFMEERESARVDLDLADDHQIRLTLSAKSDGELYDHPLTLATRVPEGWRMCRVTQGKSSTDAAVVGGAVQYEAVPGSEEIVITRRA